MAPADSWSWRGRSGAAVALGALALLGTLSCADRSRRNPLDLDARDPVDLADPLRALAGDRRVELRWDMSRFEDVSAVRLYREGGDGGDRVWEVKAQDTRFVDGEVDNGAIYRYRMSLLIEREGELAIQGEPMATPGPERGWVADGGSGLVWRVTPDGRSGLFAQGRFPALSAIAVDRQEGICWVSDAHLEGLFRVAPEGELATVAASLAGAGDLVIDSRARQGWVVDAQSAAVYRFALPGADSLALAEVDGAFTAPVSLAAAAGGGVWIADRGAGRVLRYSAEGRRLDEWRGLDGLVAVDAPRSRCCSGWALAADGERLVRLTPAADPRDVPIPFRAAALDAADATGEVWLVGETDLASFDSAGGLLQRWTDLPGGRDVAVDDSSRQVWVASATELRKITLGGLTYQTQLTGFMSNVRVDVDPGR